MSEIMLDSKHKLTKSPEATMFQMRTHGCYELFCFLSGSASFFVEGTVYHLKSGDIVLMKKAEAHRLMINQSLPYERIVIMFNENAIVDDYKSEIISFLDSRPLGTKNIFPSNIVRNTNWIYYFKKICSLKSTDKKRIYLTLLLLELKEHFPSLNYEYDIKDNIIDIITFINENLAEELNLKNISEKFYISQSQLNRRFKKITGTTVWEYIITKRLLLAKELLKNGSRPTNVFLECGFSDYCSFYRAYRKKFGFSPKNDCK